MHLAIDIVRQENPLKKTTWTFALFGSTFVLSAYTEQYKILPSPNWRMKNTYDRVVTGPNTLEAEQVPIPEEVEAELLERFISSLTVTRWKDYSKPKRKG